MIFKITIERLASSTRRRGDGNDLGCDEASESLATPVVDSYCDLTPKASRSSGIPGIHFTCQLILSRNSP